MTRSVFRILGLVASLAVGGAAMGQDGQVVAWGNNNEGQCNVPASANSGVVAIGSGDGYKHGFNIALKDGAVLAWGNNSDGQCNIPATANSEISTIAGGYGHIIVLKNSAVLAWGMNYYGQLDIPDAALSGVTAIAGGGGHSIALKGGAVLAWGLNDYGQCTIPTAALSGVTAIASGFRDTIALKGGQVLAWGQNSYGECLGTNASGSPITSTPDGAYVQIMGKILTSVTAIASGGYIEGSFTLALKGGQVFAWGRDSEGQCNIPVAAQSGVTAIAGGWAHGIALKNGTVLAWGLNDYGQCTIPTAAQSGVTAIAGGWSHTIALKRMPTTITSVFPISGTSLGGTSITITGINFQVPATVTIGGTPATNVVVVSDSQITATTPAGLPGPAVVTVNLGSSTAFYYRPSCGSDLDNSGVVDSGDLSIVLLDFGSCSDSLTTPQEQEPLIFQSIETPTPVLNKK